MVNSVLNILNLRGLRCTQVEASLLVTLDTSLGSGSKIQVETQVLESLE